MRNLRSYRLLLNIGHCFYLLVCAAYIAFMYPAAWPACLLLSICWIAVAFMPDQWRQRAIGEIAFLIAAFLVCGLQWYLYGNLEDSLNGLSRIIIVTLVLVLIPNRPGLVRPLSMLVALELLLLNRQASLSLAVVLFLTVFALSALFLDAWVRHQYSSAVGVRFRNRWSTAPWRPMLRCLVLLCLIAFPLAYLLQETGRTHRIPLRAPESGSSNRNTNISIERELHIGSGLWTDQDSYVVARFFPDSTDFIDPDTSTYIRALAVPELVIGGNGQISWRSPRRAIEYSGPDIPSIPLGSGATLIRFRSGDNILLRPDGSSIPVIDNFYFDSEENIYASDQNLSVIRYRCALPRPSYPRTARNAQRVDDPYLLVPENLRRRFQAQIPQLEQWRVLRPEEAARQIHLYLQRRCRYSTRNLPRPLTEDAGCISTFLFGDRNQRIGHCQYFASAATLLLRSCGHPARPVFGFSSPEQGPEEKSVIFRAWHGHAWTEYLDASNNWQRLDATPPGYLQERIDPEKLAQVPDNEMNDLDPLSAESDQTRVWYISLAAALLIVIVLLLFKRQSSGGLDQRQLQLARQQQALLNCARQLGINVKDSDTLSSIVRSIELRSGVNLQQELQQHLAALYNQASLPEDWPVETIISAARDNEALPA